MKGFYRLLNYEFNHMLKAVLLSCIGVIISPLMLLNLATKESRLSYERFEQIYVSSGCVIVFLIFLAALCAFFLKNFYTSYWGSKSIYTYLTLPVNREVLYFSKLSAFAIGLILLFAAQLISVLFGYNLVESRIGSMNDGQYLMENGLFLAFIRSGYLRTLLPLTLPGLVSTISIGITIITGLYYAALCERSKRYWGFIFLVAAYIILLIVLPYRMSQPLYYIPYKNLYLYSAMLLALSGWFVWHSTRLMRKGAIA